MADCCRPVALTARAPVSKTGCWGFESLLACHFIQYGVRLVLAKTKYFLEEVKVELGKVTWPTRKETVATTWVVVVIIFLISLYLGACDVILAKLMRFILG
ncbi:MAG: preprotein translocase subunit [Geobacteraceae bacterium]|nr:MAG: preprotein translocase subunit [Geobacteraceae bacterium]